MPKIRQSTSSLELQRKQIDARFRNLPPLETPRGGWIRTIRQSLGMSMRQLAKRLGISPQAVLELESREKNGGITVAKLRAAAEALSCDLKIVFVPKPSLEETVRQQAAAKARSERNRLVHTMKLEAQSDGVEAALDETRAVERWLTAGIRRLWD